MSLITLDYETYYDSKDFSLSKMTTESYIRDPRFECIGVSGKVDDQPGIWVTGDDVLPFLRSLNLPSHTMLAHNAAFDGAILHWIHGIKPKFYADTLSMARPVTAATVGGSLSALMKQFLTGHAKGNEVVQANGKRLADFTVQELAAYGEYCINDGLGAYLLYHVFKQYSTPQELYIIDMMLRMFTDPVFVVDKEALQKHLVSVLARKAKLLSKLESLKDETTGEPIGKAALMSNQQLAVVLEKLGVEVPMKTSPATGKQTFAFAKSDVAFKELLEHDDDRVQAVAAARLGVKSTLEETRTMAFIKIADRGTLPIMLKYYGAHTGRASGGDNINPQNMTRGSMLRYSLLAPERHSVVAGDSAAIEARILPWFAGQHDLVEDFRNGVDVYSKFASGVYGRTIDRKRVVKDANGEDTYPEFAEGFLGKTCILGLGFMTGDKKLQHTLKTGKTPVIVDDAEAKRIVDFYRSSMDKIVELWGDAGDALDAMVRGFEYTLGKHELKLRCTQEGIYLPNGMMVRYQNLRRSGRDVVYDGRFGKQVYLYSGKMVENIDQALARIIVFNQMAKMDQWLRDRDLIEAHRGSGFRYKLAHSVHDEIVAVVPTESVEETVNQMTTLMSTTPRWASTLPLACEVHSGISYGHCK